MFKDFIDGSKDAGQAFIPLAEKYRIAVSDIENTKKKGYDSPIFILREVSRKE